MVTVSVPLLCIGGPKNGDVLRVTAVERLPHRLAVPYTEPSFDLGYQAAFYTPTKLVLFGRVVWFLLHEGLSQDSDTAMQAVLSPAAYAAWKVGKPVPRGH